MTHAKPGSKSKAKEGAVKVMNIKEKIEDLDSSKLHFLGIGAGADPDDTKEDFFSKGSKDKVLTNLKENLPPIQGSADRKISTRKRSSKEIVDKQTAEKEI